MPRDVTPAHLGLPKSPRSPCTCPYRAAVANLSDHRLATTAPEHGLRPAVHTTASLRCNVSPSCSLAWRSSARDPLCSGPGFPSDLAPSPQPHPVACPGRPGPYQRPPRWYATRTLGSRWSQEVGQQESSTALGGEGHQCGTSCC